MKTLRPLLALPLVTLWLVTGCDAPKEATPQPVLNSQPAGDSLISRIQGKWVQTNTNAEGTAFTMWFLPDKLICMDGNETLEMQHKVLGTNSLLVSAPKGTSPDEPQSLTFSFTFLSTNEVALNMSDGKQKTIVVILQKSQSN